MRLGLVLQTCHVAYNSGWLTRRWYYTDTQWPSR